MAVLDGYPYTTKAFVIGTGSKKPEKNVNLSQKAIHNYYRLYWPKIWYNKDSDKFYLTEGINSENELDNLLKKGTTNWITERELNRFLENY